MNKVDAESLILRLDEYAKSVCKYEYGLPTYNNNYGDMPNHLDNMVEIVMNFIKEQSCEYQ